MLFLIVIGILLWRIGGAGYHWARRFLWPALVGIVLAYHGLMWWQVGLCVGSMSLANTQGYGDGVVWWRRSVVFTALAVPSLFLSWHLWALRLVLMGGLSSLFFWLSRRYNRFSHLLFESIAGFCQALTMIVAV